MAASAAAGRSAVVPGKRECMALLGALLVMVALAEPAAAAEYKVGDALGWTILGSPNYTAWALSKTFHVGDTIVFEYNKQFHNVLEVSLSNYNGCNAANPISTHTTGKDSITLKTAGHHYFLCGVPSHCPLGQKVDVNVLSSPASAPASAPAPASPARAPAPFAPARAPASLAPASSSTPAVPSVPSASSPSPSASTPPAPKSAASPSVGSGHYVAGCAVALLAVAMSLMGM